MKIQKKSSSAIFPFMSFMLHALHGRKKKGVASPEVTSAATSATSRSCPARSLSSHKRVGQRVLKPPYYFLLPLR